MVTAGGDAAPRVRADGLFTGRMRGPKGLPFLFAEVTGEASDDDHIWD